MSLAAQLSQLETAGLISLARSEPDLEYLFQHSLVQDAAYDSLLKAERRWLHQAAGEALETLYPDHLDELAPRLAEHFWQAGERQKALKYYLAAAENAARAYANTEAIDLYTRALRAAGSDAAQQASIFRMRGRLLDTIGNFDLALADDEAALGAARAAGDLDSEWQSLVVLGFLWASRDYQKTGEYYHQAEALARRLGEPRRLAHSLNWLGNYQINLYEPVLSRAHHEEALQIFTEMGDDSGIAETSDLLGMSLAISGDLFRAGEALDRARKGYEALGDRRGASSVQAAHSMITGISQTDTLVHPDFPVVEGIRDSQAALRLASEVGWRSGEVFALICLGECLTSAGDYRQALSTTARASQMANEIHHHQWQIYACLSEGDVYASLLGWERAEEKLRLGLEQAIESNSIHWIQTMTGHLCHALIAQGKLAEAQALLERNSPSSKTQTLGERLCGCARADLALRQGDPQRALEISEELCSSAVNLQPGRVIIRVWLTRGEALRMLAESAASPAERMRRLHEGETVLRELLEETLRLGYLTRAWHARRLLAANLAAQGRAAEAEEQRKCARQTVLELASSISEGELQQRFIDRALVLIDNG